MFTVVFDMTHIDDEWKVHVEEEQDVRDMVAALEKLGVEIIEVLRDDEPMLMEDYKKLLAG